MKFYRYLCVLFVVGNLGACSDVSMETAAPVINEFHEHYNNGDVDSLLALGSEGFLESVGDTGTAYFTNVREKLGTHISSNMTSWRSYSGTDGARIVMAFNSQFEHGNATEQFTLVTEGEDIRVHHYRVNSDVFIMGPTTPQATPPTTPEATPAPDTTESTTF